MTPRVVVSGRVGLVWIEEVNILGIDIKLEASNCNVDLLSNRIFRGGIESIISGVSYPSDHIDLQLNCLGNLLDTLVLF